MAEKKDILTPREAAEELGITVFELQKARAYEDRTKYVTREELPELGKRVTSQMLIDLFTDEELLRAIHSEKTERGEETDMGKRMTILRNAIKDHKGFDETEQELRKSNLRELYLRNPKELALAFCLKRNQTGKGKPYPYEMANFRTVASEVSKECRMKGENSNNQNSDGDDSAASAESKECCPKSREKCESQNVRSTDGDGSENSTLTFGQLRKIVENNGDGDDDYHAWTGNYTMDLQDRFHAIDFSNDEQAKRRLLELAHSIGEQAAEGSQSVRFYVCKYLYYAISAQILELKDLLIRASEMSVQEFIEWVLKDAEDSSLWSLVHEIYNGAADNWKKSCVVEYTDDRWRREVLESALTNFMLKGGPTEPAGEFFTKYTLVKVNDQQSTRRDVLSISQLREKTSIFGDSENEWHEENVKQVHDLKISDFYSFRIDYLRVYQLLFQKIWGAKWRGDSEEVNEEYHKSIRQFVDGLLKGERDLNRETLLSFLANVKCMLQEPKLLVEDPESLSPSGTTKPMTELLAQDPESLYRNPIELTDTQFLNVSRVNAILDRAGFLMLMESAAPSRLERFFKEIFQVRKGEYQVLYELRNEIEETQDVCNTAIEFIEFCRVPTKKYRAALTRR